MNIMYIKNRKVKVIQSGKGCWTKDMVEKNLWGFGYRYRNRRSRERFLRRQKKKRQRQFE